MPTTDLDDKNSIAKKDLNKHYLKTFFVILTAIPTPTPTSGDPISTRELKMKLDSTDSDSIALEKQIDHHF